MLKAVFIRYLFKKLLLASAAVAVSFMLLVGFDLTTYNQLTAQQEIMRVSIKRLANDHFQLSLQDDEKTRQFELAGDEWQVDLRLIRLQPYVALTGNSLFYQFERLSSRYRSIDEEMQKQRYLYSLTDHKALDVWKMVKKFPPMEPLIASVYGSSVYMPLADGAEYRISVGFSGVVAEDMNDVSRQAVSNWQ
ncbi:MAG: hypothetical protein PVG66_16755 [Chromatiales bacterium]|jgi:hypothetical protein